MSWWSQRRAVRSSPDDALRRGHTIPPQRRAVAPRSQPWITIKQAAHNNLKDIDVRIPLGLLVAVTGVSGAGKSTLINQLLYPALALALHESNLDVGAHQRIEGCQMLFILRSSSDSITICIPRPASAEACY